MTLRYKVDGYARTRDAIIWVKLSAPSLDFGLTLHEAFAGIEHGYRSVREKLNKDPARIAQWELSLTKLREAERLLEAGDVVQGKRTMQQAEELFTTLRRIGGRKVSRQHLGKTEHGANDVDE